jgi:hypothetical protein
MHVMYFPEHDQYAHRKQENSEQRQSENLNQLPSNLSEPPLAASVEDDQFSRHNHNLPSKLRLGQQMNAAPIASEVTECVAL